VLVVKKILQPENIIEAKQILVSVVSMLVGLIKAVAPDRVYRITSRAGASERAGLKARNHA
jgi:hypothetical protein